MSFSDKFAPRVQKRFLLLFAGLFWGFAGYKLLSLGLPNMMNGTSSSIISIIFAIIIFFVFFKFIFLKMHLKHKNRILSNPNDFLCAFAFFDIKGYIIIIFMITFGIVIRTYNLISPVYLSPFFTGLGSALFCAGVLFLVAFIKYKNIIKKI